jgi:XRE family transcriptional regulator, regulator of sulfur utilization
VFILNLAFQDNFSCRRRYNDNLVDIPTYRYFGGMLNQNLSKNLKFLRERRGLSQQSLSKLAHLPRSTLASIEAGGGNPTLLVLERLASALQLSIEELLSAPRAQCQLFRKGTLPVKERGQAVVAKLLPDPIPGMEIDRIELKAGGRLGGIPHRPGTREYLACEFGKITLWAAGEKYELSPGDVVAFQGDQPHSYQNSGSTRAIGFSVVTLAPIFSAISD